MKKMLIEMKRGMAMKIEIPGIKTKRIFQMEMWLDLLIRNFKNLLIIGPTKK